MDGLLIIDKPQGLSSHDVVARARRATRIRQIGHAGTLDPMATGVLVLCIGNATRLSEYLLGEDKTYTSRIKLGERTNTDDAEGEVIEQRPVPPISAEQLRELERRYTGEIQQVPPQFSAIKRGGQRAYALARKGEAVELAARPVHIHRLTLACADDAVAPCRELEMTVDCGSGTYIRSLARDIGEDLGCGGHLTRLRRTRIDRFTLEMALPLTALDEWAAHLLPMDEAVLDMPALHLDADQTRRILLGQFLNVGIETKQAFVPGRLNNLCRLYNEQGQFIAIGKHDGPLLKPVKVLASTSSADSAPTPN